LISYFDGSLDKIETLKIDSEIFFTNFISFENVIEACYTTPGTVVIIFKIIFEGYTNVHSED
jgi:MFS superfamily sulfate permease-like transporter